MSKPHTPLIRFTSACAFAAFGLWANSGTGETLPYVNGVALLQTNDPTACLANPENLSNVLAKVDGGSGTLRAVSMGWNNLTQVADAQRNGAFPSLATSQSTARNELNSQNPTVHLYPDTRIFSEAAACDNPELDAPSTGRIWSLQVTGDLSAPLLAMPDEWDSYAKARRDRGQATASCLLLGGALPRQPALAAGLANTLAASITETLPEGPNIHEARLASGLFNPGAMRLLGWDVVLLAGEKPETLTQQEACDYLLFDLLDGDPAMPTLGADPSNVVQECPAEGIAASQLLQKKILFDFDSTELQKSAEDVLSNLAKCAAQSAGTDQRLSLTIEAYGSVDGSAGVNWSRSKGRAQAARDAMTEALKTAGFVEEDGAFPGLEIASGGFGRSAVFDADPDGNRVAVLTLQAAPLLRPASGAADTGLLRRHLTPPATCEATPLQSAQTGEFIEFLASPYGTQLRDAVKAPDFVMVFHNAPDTVAFAESLRQNATFPCGVGRKTNVSLLYKRNGPPFWRNPATSGSDDPLPETVTDYFVLPPKITWIYTTSPDADFVALADVGAKYQIESQNFGDLASIASLPRSTLSRQLGELDVLTIRKSAPISEVLSALEAANIGTGWVYLVGGWD